MKKQLFTLSTSLVLAACGDDIDNTKPDAAQQVDASSADAPIDAPPAWTAPAAHSLQWSATGPDRAYSVAVDSQQRFYVAGYRATTISGDKHVIVTRLLPNGMPDTTFATGGTLDTGVVFKGGDDEIDIVRVGTTDVFVISATVAAAATNPDDAADTDVALFKLRLDGTGAGELDPTFGGGDGLAVLSVNTSALSNGVTPAPFGRDQVRGLDVRSTGEIFIHAAARANGDQMGTSTPRQDTDFVVAKILADGSAFDTAFAGDGTFEQDLYNTTSNSHSGAAPRGLIVLDDGDVLAGGYANAGLSTGPQIVMFRLTSAGVLDTAFAPTSLIPGVFHQPVLDVQTEMYNFARHTSGGVTNVVTGGYGRNTGEINDFISLRFNAATGARDTTFGGAGFTDGRVFFDPTPANTAAGSNCRNAIALPGGKTILLGSSNRDVTTGMPQNQDAVFAVLGANGALDTAYGTGIATYMLGTDGADAFWGGAANNTHALIVGWRGATVSPQVDANNDDAYAVLLELE